LNRVNHYTQLGAIFKSIIINFIWKKEKL
jgi:hypothetical protein